MDTPSNRPSFEHPEYKEFSPLWKLCRDVYEELPTNKQVRAYLPPESEEPGDAYTDRLRRATFDSRYRPAITSHAGLLSDFSTLPNTPQSLLDAIDNVDLLGNDLTSFLQLADIEALNYDACMILVEMPPEDPAALESNAAAIAANRRPYLVLVPLENVPNWRVRAIGGETAIEQLTIKSSVLVADGEYGVKKVNRYSVYRPGIRAVFEKNDKDEFVEVEDPYIYRDARGELLTYIPIVWYSSTGAKPLHPNTPPFYNLARLNLEHFRKRSELNEVLHRCNIPTPYRKHPGAVPRELPPLIMGANYVAEIPGGGEIGFAEPRGTAIAATQKDLEMLEAAMDRLAQSFLTGSQGGRTATEAVIESSQVRASLRSVARFKESAVQQIFGYWQAYMDRNYRPGDDIGGIMVSDSVLQSPPSADEVRAIGDTLTLGLIDAEIAAYKLKEIGWFPKDADFDLFLQRVRGQELQTIDSAVLNSTNPNTVLSEVTEDAEIV